MTALTPRYLLPLTCLFISICFIVPLLFLQRRAARKMGGFDSNKYSEAFYLLSIAGIGLNIFVLSAGAVQTQFNEIGVGLIFPRVLAWLVLLFDWRVRSKPYRDGLERKWDVSFNAIEGTTTRVALLMRPRARMACFVIVNVVMFGLYACWSADLCVESASGMLKFAVWCLFITSVIEGILCPIAVMSSLFLQEDLRERIFVVMSCSTLESFWYAFFLTTLYFPDWNEYFVFFLEMIIPIGYMQVFLGVLLPWAIIFIYYRRVVTQAHESREALVEKRRGIAVGVSKLIVRWYRGVDEGAAVKAIEARGSELRGELNELRRAHPSLSRLEKYNETLLKNAENDSTFGETYRRRAETIQEDPRFELLELLTLSIKRLTRAVEAHKEERDLVTARQRLDHTALECMQAALEANEEIEGSRKSIPFILRLVVLVGGLIGNPMVLSLTIRQADKVHAFLKQWFAD